MDLRFKMRTVRGLCIPLACLLAAAPTSAALASQRSGLTPASSIRASGVLPSYELTKVLTAEQLEQLLAELPIGASGTLTPEALSKALSALPQLQALDIAGLEGALKASLEGLGSGKTLEEALQNPSVLVPNLTKAIEGLLLPGQLTLLETLLGKSLSSSLDEALSQTDDGELLDQLLSGSKEPAKLLEALLQGLPSMALEKALGSTLGGGAVSEQTVKQLAESLGMSAEKLAKEAGQTGSELPETALALTAPLANGKTLSVLTGKSKATLGTLSSLISGEGAGSGSSGGTGSGGSGGGAGGSGGGGSGAGAGGQAGSGSGGSSGGLDAQVIGPTVILNVPQATKGASQPKAHAAGIKVISVHVHGRTATIMLLVPGPGTVALRNGDIHPIARAARRAGRVTLKVRLSKAGAVALRRHHDKLRLRLRVSFRSSQGASSHAPAALLFR